MISDNSPRPPAPAPKFSFPRVGGATSPAVVIGLLIPGHRKGDHPFRIPYSEFRIGLGRVGVASGSSTGFNSCQMFERTQLETHLTPKLVPFRINFSFNY